MNTSQVIRIITLVLAAFQTALAVRKLSHRGPEDPHASLGLTLTDGSSWKGPARQEAGESTP